MRATASMNFINWEIDINGNSAFSRKLERGRILTPPGAASIVECLMHEVSTISASFPIHDLIVFSRLASVSVLDRDGGVCYSLYGSSGASSGPDYCLRHSVWQKGAKKVEDVLRGLRSRTLFFCISDLGEDLRESIKNVDRALIEGCEIESRPTSDARFSAKSVRYYLADDAKDLYCGYSGKKASNNFVEDLYKGLEAAFKCLDGMETFSPVKDTFRVSFVSQRLAGIIDD